MENNTRERRQIGDYVSKTKAITYLTEIYGINKNKATKIATKLANNDTTTKVYLSSIDEYCKNEGMKKLGSDLIPREKAAEIIAKELGVSNVQAKKYLKKIPYRQIIDKSPENNIIHEGVRERDLENLVELMS